MYEGHELEAYNLGVQAAKNAASWTVDGNTESEHAVLLLRMLIEGDPAAEQYLPAMPNLSGEWADDLTPVGLYREITGRDPDDPADGLAFETLHGWLIDKLADAFEAGVSETFEAACEAELRKAVA